MKNFLSVIFLLLLATSFLGCAAVSTELSPKLEKTVPGKSYLGEPVAFGYELHTVLDKANTYVLKKYSLCPELQEELSMSRSPKRGLSVALFGSTIVAPFALVGLADMAAAKYLSDESKKVDWVKVRNTGKLLPCGEKIPAEHEELVVQFSNSTELQHFFTDKDGMFNLNEILKNRSKEVYCNLFFKADDSFQYMTTLYF